MGVPFCASRKRHWCFGARNVSLIAPGGALFPVSNGEKQFLRLTFLLEFWAGQLPLISLPYIKAPGKSFFSIYKFSSSQRSLALKFSRLPKFLKSLNLFSLKNSNIQEVSEASNILTLVSFLFLGCLILGRSSRPSYPLFLSLENFFHVSLVHLDG